MFNSTRINVNFVLSLRNGFLYRNRLILCTVLLHRYKSYYHNNGSEPLHYITYGQLANIAADRWGDRQFVVSHSEGKSFTFNEITERANKLAAGLLELGLKPGDRLGLWGTNKSWWLATFLAASKAGLIVASANPAYKVQEMEYCMKKVGMKAVVMEESYRSQNYYEIMKNIVPEMSKCASGGSVQSKKLPLLSYVIMETDKILPGVVRIDDLINSSGSVRTLNDAESKVQPDDGLNIQFTSGTTGHPKGALLTHVNIINNGYFTGKRLGYIEKKHRILAQTPFFHVFGLLAGITASLCHGTTLVLANPTFKADKAVKVMMKEKCSVIYGTPTMHVDVCALLEQLPQDQYNRLNFPELAVSGGALCSPELFKKMLSTLKLKNVASLYGLTECTGLLFVSTLKDTLFQQTSTVGYVMDHIEAKVVDSEGRLVPAGTPGELWLRGFGQMLEYWDDEEKTRELIRSDRWLKTGDLFVLTEDGYGQVVGRIKDIIIRGGENISPKEIEEYLETHPMVLEAQVYGISDERLGQEVGCSIRLKPNTKLTENEVKEFCKGNIAHFKIPKYMDFVEELPKTASGKIQKYKLKLKMEERLKNEKLQKSAS